MRTLFLLLTGMASAGSQTQADIRGTVLDPSGRPVEGARVQCGSKTVYSNNEGLFTISDIQICRAAVSKSGFQTVGRQLTAGNSVEIVLGLQGPSDRVVVTATRAETTPEQAGVAADVVTQRDFAARDYPVIADILREIPGLELTDTGRRGGLTEVYTRGADRTGTLVLLDGVPLNDPGGELHLEHLTSTGLVRMEVVRGPESALFGAEAAGGVIQLFTERGDPENTRPHATASYERGNFDTDRWTAAVSGGNGGKLDYAVSAEQFHTGGEFANDFYKNTTGTANVGYRISNATLLRGVTRIYDAHVGTPGQVGYGIVDTDANEETRNETATITLDDTRGSRYLQHAWFGYNHLRDVFNDALEQTYEVGAFVRDVPGPETRTYFVELLRPPFPLQAPAGVRLVTTFADLYPFPSVNVTGRDTAGYQGTYSQSSGTLVFGYEYQHQFGAISDVDVSRAHHGLFVNEQKTIGKRVSFSGGARLEHSSAFGSQFVPRGSASLLLFGEHGILSSTYLRASAGRGITEPTLYENFVVSDFAHGNPALKPAVTLSYEAGVVQDLFGRRLHAEVSAFRSSFKDLITFAGVTWQNIDASWARGVEASAVIALPANVRITAEYMRLYTRVTSSTSAVTPIGSELLHRPMNSGSFIASWTPRRCAFVFGARVMGEQQDYDFNFGVNRNPGYENLYLSASYDLTRHVSPVLRMDNLLNERYEEVLGYTALSRSVIGGIRVRW